MIVTTVLSNFHHKKLKTNWILLKKNPTYFCQLYKTNASYVNLRHLYPNNSSLQMVKCEQEIKNGIFALRWIKNDRDDTIKIIWINLMTNDFSYV